MWREKKERRKWRRNDVSVLQKRTRESEELKGEKHLVLKLV